MSTQRQDPERGGSEPPQNITDLDRLHLNNQTPVHTGLTREGLLLPSQMDGTRDAQMSYQPSGLVLDSPLLAAFRYHIGIYNDPSLSGSASSPQASNQHGTTPKSMGDIASSFIGGLSATAGSFSGTNRVAPNIGIYQRVIIAERKYHREYQMFAMLINGALGLQIIFAAALTALGAGSGPHTAVTAFGALNTVLAGLLTFLKGSGLPNRLKYYENEWSKLREYIEQRERDFASDRHQGRIGWDEFVDEIDKIEAMYEGVRKDIEANTPDSYISMSNAIRNMTSNNTNNQTGLPRGLARLASKYETAGEDTRRTGGNIEKKILSGINEIEHRISKGLGDLEKQTSVKVRGVVDNAHDRMTDAELAARSGLQRTQSAGQSRLVDAQNSAQSRLQNTQLSIEARLHDAQDTTQSRLHEAQDVAQSTMYDAQNKAQTTLYDAQNTAQSQLSSAQNTIESSLRDTQNVIRSTFTDAQQATQTSLQQGQNAAQAGLTQTQHQAESKAHDLEDKVVMIAEKAAERILQLTRHQHERQHQ